MTEGNEVLFDVSGLFARRHKPFLLPFHVYHLIREQAAFEFFNSRSICSRCIVLCAPENPASIYSYPTF
jgi:hypothetical protein